MTPQAAALRAELLAARAEADDAAARLRASEAAAAALESDAAAAAESAGGRLAGAAREVAALRQAVDRERQEKVRASGRAGGRGIEEVDRRGARGGCPAAGGRARAAGEGAGGRWSLVRLTSLCCSPRVGDTTTVSDDD